MTITKIIYQKYDSLLRGIKDGYFNLESVKRYCWMLLLLLLLLI